MPQVRINDDVYELSKQRAEDEERTMQAQINRDLLAYYESINLKKETANAE